ncbi:MAG: hypothetical protein PHP28_08770, partial [Actinomycetota bacterium]|nr:hypothetical protein [Actinomycetota bacterium]
FCVFMTPSSQIMEPPGKSGRFTVPTKTIPAYSRGTIRVNDYISGARPVSTVVYAEGNAEVVVAERSSYSGTVATSSSGTWSPWIIGEIWPYMFAEGYSDFLHYISIMNLGGLPGTWQVRFISNAVVRVGSTTIPRFARGTIQQTQLDAGVNFASVRDPQTDPPPGSLAQDCTSERSSYYGQWGTSSEGISMLCQRNWFYFSEGFTGHDVYIALYNPNSSTIKMKFIFYVEGVGKKLHEVSVGGGTVAVVHVNNLSWAKSYPNRGYGFEIYSENGLYFAAERSSYFN